jgi:antitoxin HicB
MDYPIVIVPLPEDEGGGFLGYAPDLQGCMSDGATREEAATNTNCAIEEWLDAARVRKLAIPAPNSAAERERTHKAHLASQIKQLAEGVDQFEERLHVLEKMAREIEEKLENQDAWGRFAELTGAIPAPGQAVKALPC